MQRDGPYDAVVVMEDGARGMNFCMSIRGYSRDVPLLWISDQAEFEPQSRRLQADFYLFGMTEYQLREAVSRLLQGKGGQKRGVYMKKKNTMPERDWQQTHEKSGGVELRSILVMA